MVDAQILDKENSTACKLSASDGSSDSSGFGSSRRCATSVGTLNAFMLFVDFSDNIAKDTTQSLYDFFVPQAAEWYKNSSYGRLKFNVTADLSRFHRMPKPSSSYNWNRGFSGATHSAYIREAIDAYMEANNKTSFRMTDVLYVIPTSSVVNPPISATYVAEVRSSSGIRFAKTAVTLGPNAFKVWKYKVINHETGHTMCLSDLYKENPSGGASLHEYVGGFDIMGNILAVSPDYFAYHKWKLGWLLDSQVDCVTKSGITTHTVSAIEVLGNATDTKAVVIKRSRNSALIAEVRSRLGNDAKGCAVGVLLYTLSTNASTGSIKVIDTTPNSGGCGEQKSKEAYPELNDAPLTVGKSFTVAEWNVKVNVTGQSGTSYTFTVEYT